MGKSPQRGYNHNIPHRGRLYHVQSEDSGLKKSHIYTHIFVDGTIIATNKVNYDVNAEVGRLEEHIVELMQESHKKMIRQLRRGELDQKIEVLLGGHPEAPHEVSKVTTLPTGPSETSGANKLPTAPTDTFLPPSVPPQAVDPTPVIEIELQPLAAKNPGVSSPVAKPESVPAEAPTPDASDLVQDDGSLGSPARGSVIDPALIHPIAASPAAARWLATNGRTDATRSDRRRRRPRSGIGGAGASAQDKPPISQLRDIIVGHFGNEHREVFDDEILRLLADG